MDENSSDEYASRFGENPNPFNSIEKQILLNGTTFNLHITHPKSLQPNSIEYHKNVLERALNRNHSIFREAPNRVDTVLIETTDDWNEFYELPRKIKGDRLAGAYIKDSGIILFTKDSASKETSLNSRVNETLTPEILYQNLVNHEVAHMLVSTLVGKNLKEIPKWFNEGIAIMVMDDPSLAVNKELGALLVNKITNAGFSNSWPSDEFLESEYFTKGRAPIEYAFGGWFIQWLQALGKVDKIPTVLKKVGEGNQFYSALSYAIGIEETDIPEKYFLWLRSVV